MDASPTDTNPSPSPRAPIGAVIIGRNEGERLRRCLVSLAGRAVRVVYVDSGSSDGSVALAEGMGASVVALEQDRPFTAARARNAGLLRLRELDPALELVQFVDGDCEVASTWLDEAAEALFGDATLAVVCGRRRERFPDASKYNRLCDIEWNTPIGFAAACGGDALMRMGPLAEVGGYDPSLIAGEEPELCFRLRQRGYRILRIDAEMTLHDANIHRFGQWWRRAMRAGHAYAEAVAMHGREEGGYGIREVRSNLAWGVALPSVCLGLLLSSWWPLAGLFLLGYPVLALRVFRSSQRRGLGGADARLYAVACVVAKFPMAYGQVRYWTKKLLGRRSTLIEYKQPPAAQP
jgi:glycosyltransferase involved in cell wall biosynthesis